MRTSRVLLAAAGSAMAVLISACGTAGVEDAPGAAADTSTSEETGEHDGPADDGGSVAEADPAGEEASATPAVDLAVSSTTLAGDAFDAQSVVGKPTVFWFWAPWCPTCRAQIDGVNALAAKHGDAINVVGVGALDDADAIAGFAGDVTDDAVTLVDTEGEVWRHFGVTEQSSYLVLDAGGVLQASGFLTDEDLASTVDGLV